MSPRCPACAAEVGVADRFCEACGRELAGASVALPRHEFGPPGPCQGCGGGAYDVDGYCQACGQLRALPDRFDADLGAAAVITDRGIAHAHNEDSVAAVVLDGLTLIAVSDGVSTSEDPQAASGAAARAGVDGARRALAKGLPAPEAALAGLAAADQAVREVAAHDGHAPSCTYVSAIVQAEADGARITVANIGDSRAYWLRADVAGRDGDANPPSQRLTVDDSWAQALVDAGAMDEQAAMNDPRAHTLIRWLGADSGPRPWADNCVRTLHTTGPGVLLVCSDGLWNYLPDPGELAALATAAAPMLAARGLVEFALRCGGSDNITVALVPVPWSAPGEAS